MREQTVKRFAAALFALSVCFSSAAFAQAEGTGSTPPPETIPAETPPSEPPPVQIIEVPVPSQPTDSPVSYEYDAGASYRIDATSIDEPPPPSTPSETATTPPPLEDNGAILDGHVREGAFLAGPGSLTFILHHTIMGFSGGLATQGVSSRFQFDQVSNREAMLAGSLIGAGVGFSASAWWQFNHWLDKPVAYFGIVNSIASGMFFAGLFDLVSNDALLITWAAFLGAEVGAWLTPTLGGGEMPLNKGLLISSGAAWGLIYGALFLAILQTSGTQLTSEGAVDALLIAPGIGAGLLALATFRYSPTSKQIVRADLFGGAVGAGVLVLSALVLGGFNTSTPYILAMLGSAGAMTAVSILYEEAAETPSAVMAPHDKRRYDTVWW